MMTDHPGPSKRVALVILGLLLLQGASAGFFLFNILSGLFAFRPLAWQVHEMVEIGAALSLLVGVVVTGFALRAATRRLRRAEDGLRAASGALHDVITDRFAEWSLTPSERDVAYFMLKGLSTAEIAGLRKTSEGTVKAQTNAIYRKSGVSGRAQLVALFVEDLLGDPLLPST